MVHTPVYPDTWVYIMVETLFFRVQPHLQPESALYNDKLYFMRAQLPIKKFVRDNMGICKMLCKVIHLVNQCTLFFRVNQCTSRYYFFFRVQHGYIPGYIQIPGYIPK